MSTVQPTFTFILATRNRRDAARAVIDRVIADKYAYGALELVVVDGESTDGTQDMLISYGAAIDRWVSVRGKGPYDAWAVGLEYAHGDFVRVLSDDDEYVPGQLPSVANAIAKGPCAEIIACRAAFVSGGVLGRMRTWFWKPNRLTLRLFAMWPIWSGFCHESIFFDRSLFARHGAWNPRYTIAADVDIIVRFLRGGARMVVLPILVLGFVVHAESLSQRYRYRGYAEVWNILCSHGLCLHAAWYVVGSCVATWVGVPMRALRAMRVPCAEVVS